MAFVNETGLLHDAGSAGILTHVAGGDIMKICKLVFLLVAAAHFSLFAAQDTTAIVKRSTPQAIDSAAQGGKKIPSVNASPGASASQQNKTQSVDKKNIIEEEDLLIEEGEVKKSAAKEAAIKDSLARLQTAAPAHLNSTQALTRKPDSAALADSLKNALPAEKVENPSVYKDSVAAAQALAEKKPAAPARVESVHSINFAKNLKDYRSPKVAMFLSLIVPGLGQAYTKHYIRTGIFVALEATAIGLSVAYNAKGKNEYNAGKSFADQNFNFDNFTKYYGNLQNYLITTLSDSSAAQDKINGIYFDTLHSMIAANSLKTADFYRNLEGQSNIYVQGWNDCEPKYTQDNLIGSPPNGKFYHYRTHADPEDTILLYLVDRIDPKDSTKVLEQGIFGYSPNQVTYSNMMSKSNDYYKLANTILAVMIINHLVSAVDALIGAMAYNNELLGKETLWQHVNIEPQCAVNPVNPSFGLAFRMGF
jgi:hypothetical protein